MSISFHRSRSRFKMDTMSPLKSMKSSNAKSNPSLPTVSTTDSSSAIPPIPSLPLPVNTLHTAGYKIRDGKMVGIKIKKSDTVTLIHNKYRRDHPTIAFEYLNACQHPKRLHSLPPDTLFPFEDGSKSTKSSHSTNSTSSNSSNSSNSTNSTDIITTKSGKPKRDKKKKIRFRVAGTVWEYNSIKNALLNAGFARTKTSNWNILWGKHLSIAELKNLDSAQKANHFPGSSVLGRKDRLAILMEQMADEHGDSVYNFVPRSYTMPEDYNDFTEHCRIKKRMRHRLAAQQRATNPPNNRYGNRMGRYLNTYSDLANNQDHRSDHRTYSNQSPPPLVWMIKPFASSCGRGIRIITESHQVPRNSKVVVQQYLSRPYLIDGRKFDLRLYCVVTSFDPLIIYLFHDGLVRFSTKTYSISPKSLRNQQIHLTNYSIQKKYNSYHRNHDQQSQTASAVSSSVSSSSTVSSTPSTAATSPSMSASNVQRKRKPNGKSKGKKKKKKAPKRHPYFSETKWSLQQLWSYLAEYEKVDTSAVIESIHDVLIKTMMAAATQINSRVQRADIRWDQCFEIFGVDLLLDHKLKPWLLEVNLLPSLSSSSPLDKRIKTTLMCDVFHCIGMEPIDIQQRKARKMKSSKSQRKMSTSKSGYFNDNANATDESTSSVDNEPSGMEDESMDPQRTLLREICDQFSRRGNLRLIFPRIYNIDRYRGIHNNATDNDHLLWGFLALPLSEKQVVLRSNLTSELSTLLTQDWGRVTAEREREETTNGIRSETESNTTVSSPVGLSESSKSAASSLSPMTQIMETVNRKIGDLNVTMSDIGNKNQRKIGRSPKKRKKKKGDASRFYLHQGLASKSRFYNSTSSGTSAASTTTASSGQSSGRSEYHSQREELPISRNNICFFDGDHGS